MTRRLSTGKAAILAILLLADALAGFGVYRYLGAHTGARLFQSQKPTDPGQQHHSGPIAQLPGTLYLASEGAIYRLRRGDFSLVLPAGGWTQPAVTPNGQSLVVVKRQFAFSDLYLVSSNGQIQAQLTNDSSRSYEFNDWAFYPRLTPDGGTLFFDWDRPKDLQETYNVTLKVWSMPLGNPNAARRWTTPIAYTGGDVQPLPLSSTELIYTRYLRDQQGNVHSELWITSRPDLTGLLPGHALTAPEDDCSQAALAPDGRRLAMICTNGGQTANLEVATFDGSTLGPPQTLVAGMQAAEPTWAPDGSGLVFLAPGDIAGDFQLFWERVPANLLPEVAAAASTSSTARTRPTPSPPSPPAPIQLTTNLDFDATSPIAWHA
ncbi:MAG TPA: hypothetical protein VKY90_03350 [Candidatus Dormibacteraeota bacterium]|nr:hypothetical protein [Candidatus Dormibacteraeota bacterium]